MMTTGAAITETIEYLAGQGSAQWIRISAIAQATGLDAEALQEVIGELFDCDMIDAQPDPLRIRVSREERELAPMIDGERRHLIRWVA